MSESLRTLIIEDRASDAKLAVRELERAGFDPSWQRVETEEQYLSQLETSPEVILADYNMPDFGAMRALEVLQEKGLDIPFIIVSGSIGEDTAVAAMKRGAADYLCKDRLARLGPAVNNALEQKRSRLENKRAAAELHSTHEQLSQLLEHSPAVIYALKVEGQNVHPYLISANITEFLGFSVPEALHYEWWVERLHSQDRDRVIASVSETLTQGTSVTEYRLRHKDGGHRWVEDKRRLIRDSSNQPKEIVGIWVDITERKRAEEVLLRLSLRESGRRKRTSRRDLWMLLGLTVLIFLAGYHFNLFEQPLAMLSNEKMYPLADETFGAGVFLTVGLMIFSYRRWKESMADVISQTHIAEALRVLHGELDRRVQQRTTELAKTNEILLAEIAERARAGEVLRESERRFREMLENVALIAVTLDKDGRVTFCNDYLLRLTGWKREEVIGVDWFANFIPDANPELKKLFFETIEAGAIPTHQENPIKTRTGELRQIVWNNTMLRDMAGNIVGTASLGEDVTEHNRARARVREQADMLDHAHDAIIIRDFEDDEITFWNKGAEHLYGWTAEEALGKPIREVMFASEKERAEPLKRLISTGEFHGEVKQVAKDGHEIIVNSRVTLIRNPNGTPRSALLINTDVTEQKKLETHLLRTQRLESIGTLASGVAHDLNNILTPILMSAEILTANPTGEDSPALISLIGQSARRGANVVKQVLTFARGVEGERVVIKPSHLIQEMIDIAQNTFPKTIKLSSHYPEDIWLIHVDPTQFHQVLLNLSVNARDAMPNGGRLTIAAENFEVDEHYACATPGAKPGRHVMFRITDTGEGISQAVIDKIFDPFFTTKEIGKGTGLGLSTVLGIVKSHGGFITVQSEIGTGTTFKIFLPAKAEEETCQKSKIPVGGLEGAGELILVVDDEPGIAQMTKMILEKHNYRVLTAEDGPDALGLIARQSEPIKIVLTDMSMPFMDGVTLVRTIRKMKPATMFIVSTGQGEETRAGELASLGVRNLLAKPYDTHNLLTTVRDTLSGAPSDGVHEEGSQTFSAD